MSKAIVLLSGGIDSSTCLGMVASLFERSDITALSLIYGQKHIKELECATRIAHHYGVNHITINISNIMQYSNSSLLVHSTEKIRHESYAEQIAKDGEGTVHTFVPFRNGLMLSIAGSIAMSLYPKEHVEIYYGAHADDAAGAAYPDCTPEFASYMDKVLYEGSGKLLRLYTPFIHFNKGEIVKKGLSYKVPYELTWSCYEGGEKACGTCGTCIDRRNAFKINNKEDPIDYDISE